MSHFLFTFPPDVFPISPYIAPILLSSILKENGYNSFVVDLNAEFHNSCTYSKDFLLKRYEVFKEIISSIKSSNYIFSDSNEKYIYSKFFTYFEKEVDDEKIQDVVENLKESIKTIKSEDFYCMERFQKALTCLNKAEVFLYSMFFIHPFLLNYLTHNFSILDYFVCNEKLNPFYDFYYEKIKNGYFDKYDYVLISQAFPLQNFGGWTLAYLLKKYTKVKVVWGGNYPSRISETLINNVKIFEDYFDYALLGLGEESILKFANYVHGKTSINEVSGLMWKEKDKVMHNPQKTFLDDTQKRQNLSFEGINFKDYLIPEVIVPIQVSKGCPWAKCTFCIFHEGKTKYQIIPPKKAALEIKHIYDNYGITKFEFVDESLSPNYYYEFAKEIINLKIDISYYGFARYDNGFTKEILETMYKSGFKVFEWGYETPTKRVMEIYNKGIDIDSRNTIMKRANEAGIWNHCLTITDVPFETKEEILYDYETYLNDSDIINSRLTVPFRLYKKAPLLKDATKYNMTNLKDLGDLSIKYSYERIISKDIMKDEDIIRKDNELKEHYKNSTWTSISASFDEYLFLYVQKYGLDKCKTGLQD